MEQQGSVYNYFPFIKCLNVMGITNTRTTAFSELMAVKLGDNNYIGYIYP
jgi:hypothetical protein